MRLREWYRENAELEGQRAKRCMIAAAVIADPHPSWAWLDDEAFEAARRSGHFGRLTLGETSERRAS